MSTLRFADRVKRVKMRATICDTVDPAEQQQQIQAAAVDHGIPDLGQKGTTLG